MSDETTLDCGDGAYNYNNEPQTNREVPWTEKYRPKDFNNIISHDEIIKSLKNFIEMKTLPHLLFFGPSGSGKTSTIKCCARAIYGLYTDCMILQLNASNERGIETVRTKIKNFVVNKNSIFLPKDMQSRFKLVILDEFDSMTVEAQGMLRQTIEKNSITTRFCLICNDLDKINIALQSRCALYRFAPLNSPEMKLKLIQICNQEEIKCNKDAIDAIIKISKGDMRASINILQHARLTVPSKKITGENIYSISGHCMPKIIGNIFDNFLMLTKKEITLGNCIDIITIIVDDNNIIIFNLLEELKNIVIKSKFSNNQKIYLINNFAKNERYDSVNVDPKNILMILSSLFVIIPDIK